MIPKPATIPQVPAALCGLFPGANARLCASFSYPGFAWHAGDVVRVLEVDAHLSMLEAVVGGTRLMVSVSDVDILLDSPLAMCHAARWLATRVGHNMQWVTTAPWWNLNTNGWCLFTYAGLHTFSSANPLGMPHYTIVPGISDLTDPAEALAAACVAVGGAP